MACEFNDLKTFLFLVLFFIIPLTSSTNIDCNGKPYHCINSTHFMICVDLGGKISTTIDDFVLACPPTTECRASNRYECEFPHNEESTTIPPVRNVSNSEDINGLLPLNVGVTTNLPMEVTTKSSLIETKTVLPVLEGNNLSNNTEILENLRKEFTDGKDTVFGTISTIQPNNVSHNEEQIIDANTLAKETVTNTDKIYSTESTKEKTTSYYSSTIAVTTMLPIEVTTEFMVTVETSTNTNKIYSTESAKEKATFYSSTPSVTTILPIEVNTKSPLTITKTVPVLDENIYLNNTEILEDIREEFTDGKDTVFKSIKSTTSTDASHDVKKIIGTPVKATVPYTDKIYSTESTIKNPTSFYSLNLGITTFSTTEVTTKMPLTQTRTSLQVLEENIFSNNTEVLEHIRKEFTDNKDMLFESINTIPPNNVKHNDEQIIAAKENIPDKIYSTDSTTERATSFYTTEIILTNTPKVLDSTTLVDNFIEPNNTNTEDQNKSGEQLPMLNKEFIQKDINIETTSSSPYIDTEQRISLEKPPDYSEANNESKLITTSNDNIVYDMSTNTTAEASMGKINGTKNILNINTEHNMSVNKSDASGTIAKSDNLYLFNFIDSKNIIHDTMNSTSKTIWEAQENVSYYNTSQDEQVRDNNTQPKTFESAKTYTSTVSTYDTTTIKINENYTNVKERYNLDSKVDSVNVTTKPIIYADVQTNLFIRQITESSLNKSTENISENGELYKNQELFSTNVPIVTEMNITENKVKSNPKLEFTNNLLIHTELLQNNHLLNKTFENKTIEEEFKVTTSKSLSNISYQQYDKLNISRSLDKNDTVNQTIKYNTDQSTTKTHDDPMKLYNWQPNINTVSTTLKVWDNFFSKPTQRTSTGDNLQTQNTSRQSGDIILVNKQPDTILSLSPKNYSLVKLPPIGGFSSVSNFKSTTYMEYNNTFDYIPVNDSNVSYTNTTENTMINDTYRITGNINDTSQVLDIANNIKSDAGDTETYKANYITTIKPPHSNTSLIETIKHRYVNSIDYKEIKPDSTKKIQEDEVTNVFVTSHSPNDPVITTININKTQVTSTTMIGSVITELSHNMDTISHRSTLSTTEAGVKNITILNDKIYINLTGNVKLEDATLVPYNVTTINENSEKYSKKESNISQSNLTEDTLLLTPTDLPLNYIKQVNNVSENPYSVEERILNGSIIPGINKVPSEKSSTLNSMTFTGATLLLKTTTDERSGNKTDVNVTPSGQVSSMDLMTTDTLLNKTVNDKTKLMDPITELSHNNKGEVPVDTVISKSETDKGPPLRSKIKSVSSGKILTGNKTAATDSEAGLFPKAEKDVESISKLITVITKQPYLEDLSPLQVSNSTVSLTSVDEGTFVKIEINETSPGSVSSNIMHVRESILKTLPDKGSLIKIGKEVIVSDKISNTDLTNVTLLSKSVIPVTEVVITEAYSLNTDKGSFTKPISTKNKTEILGNTIILQSTRKEQINKSTEQVNTTSFIEALAIDNITQVTPIAALSSKTMLDDERISNTTKVSTLSVLLNKIVVKPTENPSLSITLIGENNITKAIPNVTISEVIFATNEAQLQGTTSISKIINEERPLKNLVTNKPYLRASLSVNLTQMTERTPFSTTVPSQRTDNLSRAVTSMLPTEELSTINVIGTTLFKSSTENQFTTNDYTNNEKNSTISYLVASNATKEFGPVNTASIKYSRSNKEFIENSKSHGELVPASIVMTTESMQPGYFESTVTSNSNKEPQTLINYVYSKQVTTLLPTHGLDEWVVPTISSNNIEINTTNLDKFTMTAGRKATIKQTTESNILVDTIWSTMPIKREGNDELIKFFTSESSQPASSKIIDRAENILKNGPITVTEPLVEPPSMVEIINVTDSKNKQEVIVAHNMLGEKDSIEPELQHGDLSNKYAALNTPIQKMTVNSMSNDSTIASKTKVHEGETNDEEQSTAKNHMAAPTYSAITSSADSITKNYNKRDISTIKHVSNLTTRPTTNVDLVQKLELGKTYTKKESNTPIYKSINNISHILDNQKEKNNNSNVSVINIKNKGNDNIKGDAINSNIQSHPYTTIHPSYLNISYTQTQQTTDSLKSSIPSTTDSANLKENLNKVVFKCLNHSLGKYADNTDCRKFYICVGTLQPIIGICPNNTVFSEIYRHCTKNLSHCVRKNQFHCLYEGRFVDFTKDNIYFICVKNNLHGFSRYKLQCLKGYHVNKVSVKCEKDIDLSESASEISENYEASSGQSGSSKRDENEMPENKTDLECRNEGKFPHPKDCRKYYVCSKNKNGDYRRKIKTCSTEKKFDKDKNKCVVADSSDEC